MKSSAILDSLMDMLPSIPAHHAPCLPIYAFLKQVARNEMQQLFKDSPKGELRISPFGEIVFPYHSMGSVNTLNLFDLDELIIFSFYWSNRGRYKRVLDIGANLGLHSVILGKCGYEVRSYEPDPAHHEILRGNLELNGIRGIETHNAAISSKNGEMEFVRVLGNTTGSHLAGSKPNPYGSLDRFPVKLEAFQPLMERADLVKLDVEGHEKEILLNTNRSDWERVDALVEIQSVENARVVYDHMRSIGVGMFAQKKGWMHVSSADDMPTSYRDGTLFISLQRESVWR